MGFNFKGDCQQCNIASQEGNIILNDHTFRDILSLLSTPRKKDQPSFTWLPRVSLKPVDGSSKISFQLNIKEDCMEIITAKRRGSKTILQAVYLFCSSKIVQSYFILAQNHGDVCTIPFLRISNVTINFFLPCDRLEIISLFFQYFCATALSQEGHLGRGSVEETIEPIQLDFNLGVTTYYVILGRLFNFSGLLFLYL